MSPELSQLIELYPEAARVAERYHHLASDTGVRTSVSCPTAHAHFLTALSYGAINPEMVDPDQFEQFSIPLLVEFLKRSHQHYLNESLPSIAQLLGHMLDDSRYERKALLSVFAAFRHFCDDLRMHIQWEEAGLFPLALKVHSSASGSADEASFTRHFEEDHPSHTDELAVLMNMVQNMRTRHPGDFLLGSISGKLHALRVDLQLHGTIEDDVLLPKVRMHAQHSSQ